MRNRIKIGLSSIIILGLALILGCSRPEDKGAGNVREEEQSLTVKGSDTMVHLVSAWAEGYMKANPRADVSVTGGGTGTGIAALINGTTDICAASRSMEEKEKKLAEQKGITPKEFAVALDGIAIVVHPANPVNELSLEQLRKIYTGVYTNWSQVAGPDMGIIVLSRESSSGTYIFFQEHVLRKEDYAQTARLMPATSAIIQSATADQGSIGYVGIGYAAEAKDKIKIVNVKMDDKSAAVTPSEETVKSGAYPIARPLYLYTKGEPSGMSKGFIDFALSPEGQKVVRDTGYVTIK